MTRVLIHTAIELKDSPALSGPHTERIDPADMGPALIDGAPAILQKDAGVVRPSVFII